MDAASYNHDSSFCFDSSIFWHDARQVSIAAEDDVIVHVVMKANIDCRLLLRAGKFAAVNMAGAAGTCCRRQNGAVPQIRFHLGGALMVAFPQVRSARHVECEFRWRFGETFATLKVRGSNAVFW